ncbi:MAG: tRNA pseudouridine(38-40) synthase TruA [Thermodesulfobacteriota bacterium]
MNEIERNLRLLMAYDGTRYQGWQRQKNAPTVQGAIEDVLFRIGQKNLSLIGSGRTDAGVHAWGQVANFKTSSLLPLSKMEQALRALLPKDILIRQVQETSLDFHARYSSRAKIYDYLICNGRRGLPFYRQYVWTVEEPLDWEGIKSGLTLLTGRKDFSSFQTQGSEVAHTERTLFQTALSPLPWGGFRLRFKADGFLRHMVRNMVGLLIRVGRGRVSLRELEAIIQSKDRSQAGEMAPAHGLYLRKVIY